MDDDFINRIRALANLETIRSARIEPLNLRIEKKGTLSTSLETLRLPKFRPKRIHIITNICALERGSGTPQIFLGIEAGGEKYPVFSDTVATAEDSVSYSSQIIGLEGNQIYADFESATSGEKLILTANGYAMRL